MGNVVQFQGLVLLVSGGRSRVAGAWLGCVWGVWSSVGIVPRAVCGKSLFGIVHVLV